MTTTAEGAAGLETLTVITTAEELERVVTAARKAPFVAVDVEGNGLFAYRARLCTVQLAWSEGETQRIAIVDTLATPATALRSLLDAQGPPKVLHDFTFDVKLLAEAGVELENMRDTSVIARMLGRKATGLASLLASELGIVVPKELQQHDWSRRPLGQAELAYLAADVRHLVRLYDKLSSEARSIDIEEEVLVETDFKRESALAPPRDKGPAYLRVKGTETLDAVGLAVLRRLVQERDLVAAEWDEPPFKVASNETLLALAVRKPRSMEELRRLRRGVSARLLDSGQRLVAAVDAGIADGSVPAQDRAVEPRFDRAVIAARRAREKRLTAWRRSEAALRGVDEQVVMPGHCLAELAALDKGGEPEIAAIRGIGEKRVTRYASVLGPLLEGDAAETAVPPAERAT